MTSEHEKSIHIAKKMTCEMFSLDGMKFHPIDVINEFLSLLPRNEIPYEQAGLYRKLVGME